MASLGHNELTSLAPGIAILHHKTGSTLTQVIAWCLMASSHYLGQCWLILGEVLWYSPEGTSLRKYSRYQSLKCDWKLHIQKVIVAPLKQLTDSQNENTKTIILKLINTVFSLLKALDAKTLKRVLDMGTFIRENKQKCSNYLYFY